MIPVPRRCRSSILPAALVLPVLAGLCGCRGPAGGDGQDAQGRTQLPVRVSVRPAATAAVPGRPLTLVWRFVLGRGWHLYGPARNDSGYPPAVQLLLPEGWVAGDLQWPAPERLVLPGDILDHVYHDELVLLQDVTAPAGSQGEGADGADGAEGGEVQIPARIRWLACRDMCVPGDTTLTLTVPVAAEALPTDAAQDVLAARSRLPATPPGGALDWTWRAETLELVVPGATRLTFIADQDCGRLLDAIADADVRADRMSLRFRPEPGGPGPARGWLRKEDSAGRVAVYRVAIPGPEGDRPVNPSGG